MHRLLPAAAFFLMLSQAAPARAADDRLPCAAPVLAILGHEDAKSLVLALVDEAAGQVVAVRQDEIIEDATTQIED